MRKIAILHLLPLEYYPPVTNILKILSERQKFEILAISTRNHKQRKDFSDPGMSFFRTDYPAYSSGGIKRIFIMLNMIIRTIFKLILFKPEILFYYEPHSAFPAYFYKRYINRGVRLFIHYHEYYTPEEFHAPSMKMVRFFHTREVGWLYRKAEWISQTNPFRLEFFSKDYPFIVPEQLHVFPNFPPQNWVVPPKNEPEQEKIRLLYLGALSFENTWIKEIVEFVKSHPGRVSLGIWSYKLADDVAEYLKNLDCPDICFFAEGVDYEQIPEIAVNYDVGLVLYKPHNLNYTYNAPNKIFEYLACGLDVWFPKEMIGTYPYITEGTYPKVIKTDFEQLGELNLEEMISREGLTYKPPEYFAETIYGDFIEKYLL